MDIYNFAQSTLNKIVVFTQSGAQNDVEQTSELCCIAVYQQVPVISRPI
jgi:hypothetical protein